MNKKIAVIGHRIFIPSYIHEKFEIEAMKQVKNCNFSFYVGTHGEFDSMAYRILKNLKDSCEKLEINIVATSLSKINPIIRYDKIVGKEIFYRYEDVNFVMYEIENIFYKRKIIESNKRMIEECDILICYVNPKRTSSGSKQILNYAKKLGKEIINLYDENLE